MKAPKFPPPDPRDPPEVATPLRDAAALWAAQRYPDALLLLLRAAANAQKNSETPKSDVRVVELTHAASELAAFVHAGEDPKSIPISLDVDATSIDMRSSDLRSSIDVRSVDLEPASESLSLDIVVDAPKPPLPPRAQTFSATLREEQRPKPDTAKMPTIPLPQPPSRIDFTKTLPQGVNSPLPLKPLAAMPHRAPMAQSPAAEASAKVAEPVDQDSVPTRRFQDIPTQRAPDLDGPKTDKG